METVVIILYFLVFWESWWGTSIKSLDLDSPVETCSGHHWSGSKKKQSHSIHSNPSEFSDILIICCPRHLASHWSSNIDGSELIITDNASESGTITVVHSSQSTPGSIAVIFYHGESGIKIQIKSLTCIGSLEAIEHSIFLFWYDSHHWEVQYPS